MCFIDVARGGALNARFVGVMGVGVCFIGVGVIGVKLLILFDIVNKLFFGGDVNFIVGDGVTFLNVSLVVAVIGG